MAKILIIDTNLFVREILAEDLAAEGNVVVAIGKPELVKELILTFGPELILMDLFYNGKVRWDLLHQIKSENPHLPVILLASSIPNGDPRLAQAAACLPKSSGRRKLARCIASVLAGQRAPARSLAGEAVQESPVHGSRAGSRV